MVNYKAVLEEDPLNIIDKIHYAINKIGVKVFRKGKIHNECVKMLAFIESIKLEEEINDDLSIGFDKVESSKSDTDLDILLKQHREAVIFRDNQDAFLDSYKEGKSTLTGYTVYNTVKVKTRDIRSVSAVIDESMTAGANGVSGLSFGFDEEGTMCNELYAKATKNAYSQAQAVAKAIGSEVIGARNINTSCYVEGQTRGAIRLYKSNMAVDAKAAESTPIEAKSLKIRATIDGTFNIK